MQTIINESFTLNLDTVQTDDERVTFQLQHVPEIVLNHGECRGITHTGGFGTSIPFETYTDVDGYLSISFTEAEAARVGAGLTRSSFAYNIQYTTEETR
jgi:hypothetical protein